MTRQQYAALKPVQRDIADSGEVGQALGEFSGAVCALTGLMTVNLGKALWQAAFPTQRTKGAKHG